VVVSCMPHVTIANFRLTQLGCFLPKYEAASTYAIIVKHACEAAALAHTVLWFRPLQYRVAARVDRGKAWHPRPHTVH
jgi:hypothetical protein